MFQFPSNGKAYRKTHPPLTPRSSCLGFNSLQTGKRIASRQKSSGCISAWRVSIPFKRESVSQDYHSRTVLCGHLQSFNSLQTGKRIASQACRDLELPITRGFNSLQTGKRIASPVQMARSPMIISVSIPFKRESVSQEGKPIFVEGSLKFGFNSLQTGKRIASADAQGVNPARLFSFQFPSNGKAYRKRAMDDTILLQKA